MSYEYDPKYPDTTTTMNNEGNPGANDPYGYDEHDNDDDDWYRLISNPVSRSKVIYLLYCGFYNVDSLNFANVNENLRDSSQPEGFF